MHKLAKNVSQRRWENLEAVILDKNNSVEAINKYVIATHLEEYLMSSDKIKYDKNLGIFVNLLPIAAWENRPIIVNWLLNNKKVSPLIEDAQYGNTLYIAIEQGNFEIAEMAIKNRVLQDFPDEQPTFFYKFMRLMWKKVFYDEKNHPDNLLMLAIQKNEDKIVAAILKDYKFFPKQLLTEGLIMATRHVNLEMVKSIVATRNVNLNYYKPAQSAFKEALKFWEDTPKGPTALLEAVISNNHEIVDVLLYAGVDTKAWINRITTTHIAASAGSLETLQVIVKHQIDDINASFTLSRFVTKYDAIYMAVKNRHHEIVKCLIEEGADFNRLYDIGLDKLQSLIEIAQTTEKNSKSCYYIKNGAAIKAIADNRKAQKVILEKLEEKQKELRNIEKTKRIAASQNHAAVSNFDINYPTQIVKSKSARGRKKQSNQIQNVMQIETTANKGQNKIKKTNEKLIKDRTEYRAEQPLAVTKDRIRYNRDEDKALEHEHKLASQRKLDLAEQQALSQFRISENFNSNQIEIEKAQSDIVKEIEGIFWLVLRDVARDHEWGRPAILLARRGKKAIVLLSTTKEAAKNKPHLAIELDASGPTSYFSEVAIIKMEQLKGPCSTQLKVSENYKKVASKLIPKKILKKLYPERCFDWIIETAITESTGKENNNIVATKIDVSSEQLIPQTQTCQSKDLIENSQAKHISNDNETKLVTPYNNID